MSRIPGGEFWMGSPEGDGQPDERPRHLVCLDAFAIDRCEVTVAQYRGFCAATRRSMPRLPLWSRDDHPIVNVAWSDAQAYCAWAGKMLPTEAQWERAARGAAETRFHFGDSESLLGEHAWFKGNSDGQTHPVGWKRPNPFGLFDMHGNVWEWIADWYDPDYYARSPARNPTGPAAGSYRVMRGGSWNLQDILCRAAARNRLRPDLGGLNLGFRCAAGAAPEGS